MILHCNRRLSDRQISDIFVNRQNNFRTHNTDISWTTDRFRAKQGNIPHFYKDCSTLWNNQYFRIKKNLVSDPCLNNFKTIWKKNNTLTLIKVLTKTENSKIQNFSLTMTIIMVIKGRPLLTFWIPTGFTLGSWVNTRYSEHVNAL